MTPLDLPVTCFTSLYVYGYQALVMISLVVIGGSSIINWSFKGNLLANLVRVEYEKEIHTTKVSRIKVFAFVLSLTIRTPGCPELWQDCAHAWR